MRLLLKPQSAERTDFEYVFGVLFIPLYTLFVFLLSRLPLSWVPRCRFHATTGIPCPGCGAFRGARLLFSGHALEAWLTQPILISVAFFALAYSLYSWIVVVGRLPRLHIEFVPARRRSVQRKMILVSVLLFLTNWMYLILDGR
jgi:hypothetical protein